MAGLSIHNLDEETERRVRQEARRRGESLPNTLKHLIQAGLGQTPKDEQVARRLAFFEQFLGTWTDRQYRKFEEAVADCERIDPEEWE